MRRLFLLLVLSATAAVSQEGGRDPGDRTPPVLFVRWRSSTASHAIYSAAWSALERFDLSRERLLTFHGDAERAGEILARFDTIGVVVAFDAESAAFVAARRPNVRLVRVGPRDDALVDTLVDRDDLARLLRRFHPGVRRVAVFGGTAHRLPGLDTYPCSLAGQAKDCDVAWIPETSTVDARALRDGLDALGVPLVATSDRVDAGLAALTVRVDPGGAGRQAAAQVLRVLRGKETPKARVRRLHAAVDLEAAAAAGHRVPLEMLARADAVRRAP